MEQAMAAPVPHHERLGPGLVLTLVGGMLESYTYLLRGGVFCNAQSVNMIMATIQFLDGSLSTGLRYLLPVFAFALGVFVEELIRHRVGRTSPHWRQSALVAEAALLVCIGLIPTGAPHWVVNCLVSAICGMQMDGFRRLKGSPLVTTICTGNLRSFAEFLFYFLCYGDKAAGKMAGHFLAVLLVFCLGGGAGVLLVRAFSIRAIWAGAALLVATALYLWQGARAQAAAAAQTV